MANRRRFAAHAVVLGILAAAAACHQGRAARTGSPAPSAAAGPASQASPDLTDGEDATAVFAAWNAPASRPPSVHFRDGHVTPKEIAPSAVSRDARGFKVSFPSGGLITTPAVHAGKVLVSGGFSSKEIYAFQAKTGQPVWALELDDDGPSSPACEDDTCVFNTESCTLFAVRMSTGQLAWSHWLGDPLMSAPTISGGVVYAAYPASADQGTTEEAGDDGEAPLRKSATGDPRPIPSGPSHALGAFDLATGKALWARWIDADVMSAPVASGDAVYATTFAGTVIKLDAKSGAIRAARRARATSAPTIANGSVYYTKRSGDANASEAIVRAAPGNDGYVTALRSADYLDHQVQQRSQLYAMGQSLDAANGFGTGAPASANASAAEATIGQVSVSTLQSFQGSRVLSLAGRQNVNVMGDEIVATSPEGGRTAWRFKLPGDMRALGGHLAAAPVSAGGSVLVATLGGEILRFDPASGKLLQRWAVGGPIRSQPVVEDGFIYVGTENGKLVAIDTGDRSLTGWRTWGGNAQRNGR